MIKFHPYMDKKSITQQLLSLSGPDKRISCTEARKLARESHAGPAVVGKLCNELGIKIYGCELGCF
jgi:hypothetical protein